MATGGDAGHQGGGHTEVVDSEWADGGTGAGTLDQLSPSPNLNLDESSLEGTRKAYQPNPGTGKGQVI